MKGDFLFTRYPTRVIVLSLCLLAGGLCLRAESLQFPATGRTTLYSFAPFNNGGATTTPPVFVCADSLANLVQNGSFETGVPAFNVGVSLKSLPMGSISIDGRNVASVGAAAFYWANGAHTSLAGTGYSPASDGNLYLYFNGAFQDSDPRGVVSTTVTFPVAGTYWIGYDSYSEPSINGSREAGFTADIAGVASFTDRFTPPFSINSTLPANAISNWKHAFHAFVISAPGAYVLSFKDASSYGDPGLSNAGNTPSPLLDNVTVVGSCCDTRRTVSLGQEWAFHTPVAWDAGSGTNVVIKEISTVTNGVSPQVITRTWSATEIRGNVSMCSETVTIEDSVCSSPTVDHYGLSGNQLSLTFTSISGLAYGVEYKAALADPIWIVL